MMKALICDICGGKLIMDTSTYAVCESCGMHFTKTRIQKKIEEINNIKIDNTHLIPNYLINAKREYKLKNYANSEEFCHKILELQPDNADALYQKALAIGYQTTLNNFRLKEAIFYFIYSIENTDFPDKSRLHNNIIKELKSIFSAYIIMRGQNIINNINKNEINYLDSDLDLLKQTLEMYVNETTLLIPVNEVLNQTILILTKTVKHAFMSTILEYKQSSAPRNAYYIYVRKVDLLIDILQKAIDLLDNDEDNDKKLYKIIIALHKSILDNNITDLVPNNFLALHQKSRLTELEVNKRLAIIELINNKINKKGD